MDTPLLAGHDSPDLGAELNEGVTEYFTRLFTDRNGNPPSADGEPCTGYQRNWDFVRDILPLLGNNTIEQEVALAEMYFNAKPSLLKDGFQKRCAAKHHPEEEACESWETFNTYISFGTWNEARWQIP